MANPPEGKSGNGGPNLPTPQFAPPEQVANVPAPPPSMDMNSSFILQTIIDVQKSVSELGAKTERLILDVAKQNEKIDELRGIVNVVRGVMWLAGILLAGSLTIGIAVYNKVVPAATPVVSAPVSPSSR